MAKPNYVIAETAVKDLLSNLINKDKLGDKRNLKHVLDLLATLPEHSISALLSIILIKEEHVPIKLGDTVKHQPSPYSSIYDKDIMIDKGLMDNQGYIYGTVIADGSWNNNDEFNPYYNTMKVNFFVWEDNDVRNKEDTIKTFDLTIIDPSELPEFNTQQIAMEFLDSMVEEENDVPKDDTLSI